MMFTVICFLSRSVLGAVTIGLYVVLWGTEDDGKSERMVEQDNIVVKVESENNLSEPVLSENVNAESLILRRANDIALL